jgi:hypothetical protein
MVAARPTQWKALVAPVYRELTQTQPSDAGKNSSATASRRRPDGRGCIRHSVAQSNLATRGLLILLARLTTREHKRIFSLCHYFAIMKPVPENESRHLGQNEMAGLKGKSGPPGNMNAFKHGLAAIQKRREESITTEHEENVRQQILDGLMIGLNDLQYEFEAKIEVQCSRCQFVNG